MTGATPRRPEPPSGAAGSAEYRAEHLRAALAADRRVHEQGLDVTVVGSTIVIRGTVATAALRDSVGEVARELIPAADIVNDVEVTPNPEPGAAEELG